MKLLIKVNDIISADKYSWKIKTLNGSSIKISYLCFFFTFNIEQGKKIQEKLLECLEYFESKVQQPIFANWENAISVENHESVLQSINEHIEKLIEYKQVGNFSSYISTAEALFKIEQKMRNQLVDCNNLNGNKIQAECKNIYNTAQTLLEYALTNCQSPQVQTRIFLLLATREKDIQKARNYAIAAMENDSFFIKAMNIYKSLTEEYLSKFNNTKQIGDEQNPVISFVSSLRSTNVSPLIFIVQDELHLRGCYDSKHIISNIFSLDKIPSELTFPIGHPTANTLYMPHPINSSYYIPYETAEETLFIDRIREFCYLAQCLGATKISCISKKDLETSSQITNDREFSLDTNIKGHEVCGKYEKSYSQEVNRDANNGICLNQEFKSGGKPYIPKDLGWYPTEIGWQQIAKQRIEGTLLQYDITLTSEETLRMSSNQKMDIDISYKCLIKSQQFPIHLDRCLI